MLLDSRLICILAAALLLVVTLQSAANAQALNKTQETASVPMPYQGVTIKRWSPIVSDLDETIHLFTDILGLELASVSIDEVPGAKVLSSENSPRMSALLLNTNGHFDEIVRALSSEGYQLLSPHALGKNGIEIGFIDKNGHLYALYEFPYQGSDHDLKQLGEIK